MTVLTHPSSVGGLARGSLSSLQPFEIDHPTHIAVVEPDTAFWGLVRKDKLTQTLSGSELLDTYIAKAEAFRREMEMLRFHLKPSAVYFNPTERCNLNCSYCYIPEQMRRGGEHMEKAAVLDALERLHMFFRGHMPEGRLPQVIFHGAEPMLNRDAVFAGTGPIAPRGRIWRGHPHRCVEADQGRCPDRRRNQRASAEPCRTGAIPRRFA